MLNKLGWGVKSLETFIYKNRFNVGWRKNTQLNEKHQTKL
jgi:hypothetical protein